ncbi:hypothetical protein HY989_02165 [Candidatus Micrarchaeota archaeon]|nr:hypothetical protein [Candidatus Micrarchaeota archaeon]
MAGKLIVLEGTDAVGKRTQSNLLEKKLKNMGMKVEVLNFPTYESAFGSLIGNYLHGKFGSKDMLPPEAVAALYSLDRYQYKDELFSKLKKGTTLICNRYSQSNLYQAAKIADSKEREKFIGWMFELDSRLPKADAVFFLNLDPSVSTKLLKKRGEKIDLHEKDLNYQNNVRKLYLEKASENKWAVIDCARGNSLRGADEISTEIFEKLKKRLGI